jgi:hypothetical protein
MTSTDPGLAQREPYAAEDQRTKAMVDRDLAVLERIIADDCRYVHSSGATDTKASYLAKLGARAFEYTWITSHDRVVIEVGSGYAVSHIMAAQLVMAGVPRPYRSQALALWRSTSDGLRLVYFQATLLPTAALPE